MEKLAWLAAVISSTATAMPAVGDSVVLAGTLGGAVFSQTTTLVAHDDTKNRFEKKTTTVSGSQPVQVQDEWVDASSLPSDAQADLVLGTCAQNGGTRLTIQVKAGSFDVCRMAVDRSGSSYVGKVPFGVVKIDTVLGSMGAWQAELQSVTRGTP